MIGAAGSHERGPRGRISVLWLVSLLLSAAGVAAADRRPVIDLLTPMTDPTDDWRIRTTRGGGEIQFYGQVSPSLMSYDDGNGERSHAPVGNANAAARLGFYWHMRPLGSTKTTFRAEIGVPTRPSNSLSQVNKGADWLTGSYDLRKLELILDSERWGALMIGQGSMASDGIAEIDLSGTAIAAHSSVDKPAGGYFLRTTSGALSPITIAHGYRNLDGDSIKGTNADGSRKLRVRYDTPEVSGFRASVAAGVDAEDASGPDFADVALRYDWSFADWRISAGAGHALKAGERITSGSLSALNEATGLNVTFAAGNSSRGADYSYLKFGLLRKTLAFGETAVSVDLYRGADVASAGSRSNSVGFAVVQQIDSRNIEVFGLVRRYAYSDPDDNYEPGSVLMAGLRWSF